MREEELSRKLKSSMETAVIESVVVKHCDTYTRGLPDISWTFYGGTTWVEVKKIDKGKKEFAETGQQRIMTTRMARFGSCVYVVYHLGVRRVTIHVPTLAPYQGWPSLAEFDGHDHKAVALFIRDYARRMRQ